MERANLGEFEELVLLTVASLGDEAYAVSVRTALWENAERKVNISAVHSSLYRLEKKGYLTSDFGGATSKRGGKSKRFFKVTNTGLAALQESKDLKQKLWRNIPQLTFQSI